MGGSQELPSDFAAQEWDALRHTSPPRTPITMRRRPQTPPEGMGWCFSSDQVSRTYRWESRVDIKCVSGPRYGYTENHALPMW